MQAPPLGFKERVGNHRFSRTISARCPRARSCDWLAGRCNHRSDCPTHHARRLNRPFSTCRYLMTPASMSLTRTLRRGSGRRARRPPPDANGHLDEKPAPLPQAQWTLTSARCHGIARRRCPDPPVDAPRRSYPTCAGPSWRTRPLGPSDTMPLAPCHQGEAGTTFRSCTNPAAEASRPPPPARPVLPHAA